MSLEDYEVNRKRYSRKEKFVRFIAKIITPIFIEVVKEIERKKKKEEYIKSMFLYPSKK